MSTKIKQSAPAIIVPTTRVTTYDRVSSGLLAVLAGLVLVAGFITYTWLMNRPGSISQIVPVEMIDLPGGVDDGAIDETLLVESPLDPVPDAAPEPTEEEVTEIEEVFETVTELAEVAAVQMLQQYEQDVLTGGTPGSREGTGRRALGADGGQSGLPPEQRWYIQFANQKDLDEYARQLDFFGIELGTILPEGRLVYLSNLSQPQPETRFATSGRDETRMYMTWQGGELKAADGQLFRKAGMDASASRILHFYPKRTEDLLKRLEFEYAMRPPAEIRRTYFQVIPAGNGYDFRVSRQSYFR